MVNFKPILKGITDKINPPKKTTQTTAPEQPTKSVIITDKTSYKQDPFSPTGYSDKYNNPVSVKPTPQQELVNKKPNKSGGGQSGRGGGSGGGQSGRGGGSGVGTPSNDGGSTIPVTTPTIQTPQSSGNVIGRDYGNKLEPMKVSGGYATGWGWDIIKQDVKYFFTGKGYVKNPLEPYSYTGGLSSDLPTGRFKTGTISTSNSLGQTGYNPYISYGDIQKEIDMSNMVTTSNIVYKYQSQVTDKTTPEEIKNININLNKEIQKTNYKPSIVNWNERTGSNIVQLGNLASSVAIASNPYTSAIASGYYLNKGDTTSGLLYAGSAFVTRGLSGYSKTGKLKSEISDLQTQPWRFKSYSVNTESKGLTTLRATRFNEDASLKQTLKIIEPSSIKRGNTFSITGVNKGIGMVTTKGNLGGTTIKATQTFTTSGISLDILKANKFTKGFSFKSAYPRSQEVIINSIPKYTKGGKPSMNFNLPNKAWMLEEKGSTQTWLARTGSGDIGLAKTTFKESNVNNVKIFQGGQKKSSNEYFKNLYNPQSSSLQIQETIIKTKTRGGRSSRGGSVLDQIQTPKLRVNNVVTSKSRLAKGLKLGSASATGSLSQLNVNSSQRRSGYYSVSSSILKSGQGQKQGQTPILKINQIQKQGSVFSGGSYPSPPIISLGIPTGFGLPVFKWPSSDSSGRRRGKGNNKTLRIGGYSPSYTAVLFNIKGKQPKRVTGLEIRPITTGKLFKIKISNV